VAFSFVAYNQNYCEEVYGLLGLQTDDPIMPSSVVDENKPTKFLVENKINSLVDFDNSDAETQEKIYNAALFILAGYLYKYYMPNAVPKYMSSNKTVFERFKNTDFNQLGEELIAQGVNILEVGASSTFTTLTFSPLGVDPVTGEGR